MLAGRSHLDLVPLFDVSVSALCDSFGDFLEWISLTLEFPLVAWMRESKWDVLLHLASQFAEKTGGAFFGPFAALDGIAMMIKCPKESEVPDPGNCHCRKGFHARNAQAMCDKLKRFLWCCPSNKGSSHDAAAFGGSRLFDLLKEELISNTLCDMGVFIAGDTACPLAPFLIVPHDVRELRGDVMVQRMHSISTFFLAAS